jgi:hypothetical protein
VGAKFTETAQVPAAASDVPQVFDWIAKAPVIAGAWSDTAAPPLFVPVKVTEEEVAPTTTDPKLLEAGESVRLPGASPVPESAAIAGLAAKPPAMLSVPDSLPVTDGLKSTTTEQE